MTLCIAALCRDNSNLTYIGEESVAVCFDSEVQTDIAHAETGLKFDNISDQWSALLAGVA
jgi:hypothetical protein